MVDKIFDIKAKVLEHMEGMTNQEKMDVQQIGMLADVVKDLSMAEKDCWEAEYYKSVTKAMAEPKRGYDADRKM